MRDWAARLQRWCDETSGRWDHWWGTWYSTQQRIFDEAKGARDRFKNIEDQLDDGGGVPATSQSKGRVGVVADDYFVEDDSGHVIGYDSDENTALLPVDITDGVVTLKEIGTYDLSFHVTLGVAESEPAVDSTAEVRIEVDRGDGHWELLPAASGYWSMNE